MASCDESAHVESGAHAGASTGDSGARRGLSGLADMGGRSGQAGDGLAVAAAEFEQFGQEHLSDVGADAGDGEEDAAVFGALLILGDAAFDLVLDAPAGFGESEDGGFVAFADQAIESLLEAALFHSDHFGELAPAGGQRLKRDLVGVAQRAEGVAHAISEARDEAGVQPVGLGAFAFGDAEGLDAARIDEADGKAGRRQSLDERVGVGADRLQHHPFDALALEACEQGGEGLGPVGGPKDGAGR